MWLALMSSVKSVISPVDKIGVSIDSAPVLSYSAVWVWLLKTPSVVEIQGFRSGSGDGYGIKPPRAAESILGCFEPPQPFTRGSGRKPKPEYEMVGIVPPI